MSTGENSFHPLDNFREYSVEDMKERARLFHEDMKRRRSVRHFSDRNVPAEVIENCLRAASTAPSGANMQPWHFVVIYSSDMKKGSAKHLKEEKGNSTENNQKKHGEKL